MSDDSRDEEEGIPESGFFLPEVASFVDCNHNFQNIAEAVTIVVNEIRSNAQHTQLSMTKIVEDVNKNMLEVSGKLNSILTTQVMMVCVVIIALSLTVVSVKALVDIFLSIYHYGL